jgi:PIN domain nuclease of toxin-antitoxin system
MVIDASAILAYLQDEEGSDLVEVALEDGLVSAITFTEVLGKLVGKGVPAVQALADLEGLGLEVVILINRRPYRLPISMPAATLTASAWVTMPC